jgi:aspartate oxidase
MQVVKVKKVEGCLEGTNVKDLFLDIEMSKDFIDHLGSLGKLIYFDETRKPIFKVIVRGQYTLKGAESTRTIRILMPEDTTGEEIIATVREHIGKY